MLYELKNLISEGFSQATTYVLWLCACARYFSDELQKKKTGLNVGVAMDKKWAGIPFFWHERSQGCSPVKKKEKKRKNKFERWVSVRRDELKKERKESCTGMFHLFVI